MSLVGDLEFKTVIDDRPAIIKIPNAHLYNINVLVKNKYNKEITFEVTAISDTEEEH